MVLWIAGSAALAQQRSVDFELLRPAPSARGVPGVQGAATDAPGTVRVGAYGWYEADPLVLEQDVGDPELSVVGNRALAELAFSADLSRVLTVRATLPAAVSWGSSAPGWQADGVGLADLSAGFGLAAIRHGGFTGGLYGDLLLPSGRQDAWLGESAPRLDGGIAATLVAGRVTASADAGFAARTAVDTGASLTLGSAVVARGGVAVSVVRELSIVASALGSFGLTPGAEAAEGLVGARVAASEALSLDLLAGHGFSHGIGAPNGLVLAAVTFRHAPRPPVAPEAPRIQDAFSLLPEADDPEEPDAEQGPVVVQARAPEWQAEQLARVGRGEVELRDPIRFDQGSAAILPESHAMLEQVAEILRTTPEIVHVVIVGHASNEGSYETNYRLSLERAAAVYDALLRLGVHPDRLSILPMGEVVPSDATDTEAAELARKVEFRIARALGTGEAAPVYVPYDRLPTDGSPRTAPGGGAP